MECASCKELSDFTTKDINDKCTCSFDTSISDLVSYFVEVTSCLTTSSFNKVLCKDTKLERVVGPSLDDVYRIVDNIVVKSEINDRYISTYTRLISKTVETYRHPSNRLDVYSVLYSAEETTGDRKRKRTQDTMIHINDILEEPLRDKYGVITLLHVLSRCSDVKSLLTKIKDNIKQGGLLIVSDYDCRSWSDYYRFDLLRYLLHSIGLCDTSKVYSYRSREWYRVALSDLGYKLIYYRNNIGTEKYREFYDVYTK